MTRGDLLDWALYGAMHALPMRGCSDLGAALAPVLGKRPYPGQHRKAKALFASLRPDWAVDDITLERAVDRLWANIGRTYAEFAVSHRMLKAGRVAIEGAPILQQALSSGRPIVAVFPHLGNWELSEMQIGFLAPNRGAVIVAPPEETAKAKIAERVRRRAPAELLPLSRTVWRQALAKLRSPGGGIMLAIDEQGPGGRVLSPSWGGTPSLEGNMSKAARLALMTDALVVPFHNERLPGARFVTHVLPSMTLPGRAGDEGAVREAVWRLDAVMRPPILRLLDQWYMALFAEAPHGAGPPEFRYAESKDVHPSA